MKGLGKGQKASKAGNQSIDELGLTEQSSIDYKAKLRGETGEAGQRPTATDKSVKSDRGAFKNKC